jgi:hypothetical protein
VSWLSSPRHRWWLLAAGWTTLLVLGVGGFVQQSEDLDLDNTFLDHLYLTLQLAALDFEGESASVNWRLQIARFAAPVMAAGTILQSASVVFREQFTRWRLRRRRNHVVVCGLGPAGTRTVLALAAAGRDVAAVEADPSSPGIASARDHDVDVLVGDPTEPGVLQAMRVDRASRVIAATPDDATNVAIAAAAASLARSSSSALRCTVDLTDAALADLLRAAELGGAGHVRVEFSNLHDRAARSLLAEHPMTADPHLVVLGLGQFGASVVLAAAQQHALSDHGPLRLTLVERAASGRFQALRFQHPALVDAVKVQCLDLDLRVPDQAAVDGFTAVLAASAPTLVVVAFEDESLALSSALFVRRLVRDPAVPVVVRTESDGGLSGVVDVARTSGLVTFPFLARACTLDAIDGGVREQLAKSIHEDHVARAGGTSALHRRWELLDDADRESSRRAADGIVERLAGVGCELVPLQRWGVVRTPLTDAEIDRLAAAEHARWRAEREADGWRWGERRDDPTKRNPLLVDWSDLPDDAKRWNLDAARQLPAMLARAGFEIARR